MTKDEVIRRMVDREISAQFPVKTNTPGETLMKVEHLTRTQKPACKDVSFELKRGEIPGVSGLDGAGKTELLETIYGMRRMQSGRQGLPAYLRLTHEHFRSDF